MEYFELNPKLSPAVLDVYNQCGTYIESPSPEAHEHELEYFVEQLINNICEDLQAVGVDGLRETLLMMGYIKNE